jgi:hypothetical protein
VGKTRRPTSPRGAAPPSRHEPAGNAAIQPPLWPDGNLTAAGEAGLSAVLDAAWRVRLPQTGAVLDALASTTADKAVAKAARKAVYELRSAR